MPTNIKLRGGLIMRKLFTLSALLLFSVDVFASVNDMTAKFLKAKEELVACDTLKSCNATVFEYYDYMYHPDNQKDLVSCGEQGKCYEAMMDMTKYLMTDYQTKLKEIE